MTTTATKVTTKWDTKKTQETTANMIASLYMSAYKALATAGEKAHEEFNTILLQHKIDHYKHLGVKNPWELVQAMAETDHNLFGSEIELTGDQNKATITYKTCGMWNACQKLGKMTPEQETKMGEQCAANTAKMAKEFGFNFEPHMDKDTWAMTFSK